MPVRVLVADDSALMRKKIKEMLESAIGIEVVATARDGVDVLQKAEELKPDVITLDVNMPNMDGITALKRLMEMEICPVIMLSSLTQEGAAITFEALEIGAFDYVAKPGGTVSLHLEEVRNDLVRKVREASKTPVAKLRRPVVRERVKRPARLARPSSVVQSLPGGTDFPAVCIGVSTGGPKTIFDILPKIPKDFPAAIFMVQHMPGGFTESFARRLNEACEITVKEAAAGDFIEPGVCYLGKGGYHLGLHKNLNGRTVIRLKKNPETTFIPSVDVMMESVVGVFGGNTVGVILTGMGNDGTDGMGRIKRAGGATIAESEETAIVFGMPREAIEKGFADTVLPSYGIASEVIRIVEECGG